MSAFGPVLREETLLLDAAELLPALARSEVCGHDFEAFTLRLCSFGLGGSVMFYHGTSDHISDTSRVLSSSKLVELVHLTAVHAGAENRFNS